MRCSTLTRMSGNGSGGENGRILTHDFPKTVQTLPCMSHTASMGLGASGMWSSRQLCWRRGTSRVGQKKSTRLLGLRKPWLSGLTHHFSWLSTHSNSYKTLLTAKMHSRATPYKLRADSQRVFFRRFEKQMLNKRREMCCNKEAVNGAFLNFLQCSFMWIKKNLILQPALCHFNGAVDISPRVQYLHLPRWPCTTYCRCFLVADGTCLCTDVAEEDKHLWLLWWFDIVLRPSRSLSFSHFPVIFEGRSALCSKARFYSIYI